MTGEFQKENNKDEFQELLKQMEKEKKEFTFDT